MIKKFELFEAEKWNIKNWEQFDIWGSRVPKFVEKLAKSDEQYATMSETDFLKRVREVAETGNLEDTKAKQLYSRFYTLVKNKGLDVAKEKFKEIDPYYSKLKEKESKTIAAKKQTKDIGNAVRDSLPSRSVVSKLINNLLLTGEVRAVFNKLSLPPLFTENYTETVYNPSKTGGSSILIMDSDEEYKTIASKLRFSLLSKNTPLKYQKADSKINNTKRRNDRPIMHEDEDDFYSFTSKEHNPYINSYLSSHINLAPPRNKDINGKVIADRTKWRDNWILNVRLELKINALYFSNKINETIINKNIHLKIEKPFLYSYQPGISLDDPDYIYWLDYEKILKDAYTQLKEYILSEEFENTIQEYRNKALENTVVEIMKLKNKAGILNGIRKDLPDLWSKLLSKYSNPDRLEALADLDDED